MAPFEAGQYLGLAVRPSPEEPLFRRSYAISSDPTQRDYYRITIRCRGAEIPGEPAGVVSGVLHEDLRVGDRVRTAAPRGFFTLTSVPDDCGGLVLISRGIGNAPVISMLRQWEREFGHLPAYVFHEETNRATHSLRGETIEMKQRQSGMRLHVVYTDTALEESLDGAFESVGELTAEQVAKRVDCDRPKVFIAGETSFVERMRDGLLQRSFDGSRIRDEGFGR